MKKVKIDFDFEKWGQEGISVIIQSEDIIKLHQNPIKNIWFYGLFKNGNNFVCLYTDLTMYQEVKPREIWVNEFHDTLSAVIHTNKKSAISCKDFDGYNKSVKFREVLDDEQ